MFNNEIKSLVDVPKFILNLPNDTARLSHIVQELKN